MATQLASVAQSPPSNFPALLEQFKDDIKSALPQHLNAERMARIALTAFRRNSQLGHCDPKSVFAAVLQAAQIGLEPDLLGRSYLVPYGKECQFIPGWKGLVDLVNRAGTATVWTGAVFAGDIFEYGLGDSPYAIHKPSGEIDPAQLTHVYAVGRVKDSQWPILEVWSLARVAKHRDRYNKQGRKHYSFQHLEMYARKVVLLQVLKYLPASPELAAAIALNDAAEIGEQHLTVEDAIDGTWSPVTTTPAPTPPEPPALSNSEGSSVIAIHPDRDTQAPEAATSTTPSAVINPAQLDKLTIMLDELDLDPQRVCKYAMKIASVKGIPMKNSLEDLPLELYDYLVHKLPDLAKAQARTS